MSAAPAGYKALRPGVLRFLRSVEVCGGGETWLTEWEGSFYELLEAGVISEPMFERTACGQKSGCDEYGDRYTVRRRAGGRIEVERWFGQEAFSGNRGPGRGWKALGSSVTAEVEAALKRMRRPRKELRP